MRMPCTAAVAFLAAALFVPHPAAAETAFGVRFFGGYNTYALGDWDDVRRALFVPASQAGDPHDGHSLGIGLDLGWGPWLAFTGSYERLVPGRMSEVNGEKLKLPANALLLEAEFHRRIRPRLWVGVGGGIGHYQLGEEVESPGTNRNLEGDNWGSQLYGLVEWEWTSMVSLGLDVGYRKASVDVTDANRQPPRTETVVDYSGLNTRLVMRLHRKRAR